MQHYLALRPCPSRSVQVIILLFFLSWLKADAATTYIGVEDGLSNRFVTCILQDHDGLIWIGTSNGLNVYDGYSFRSFFTFSSDLKLSNSRISGIVEDKDGNVWVATERGLNRIVADRSKNEIIESAKDFNLSSIILQRDNNLLLGTADGQVVQIDISSLAANVVYKGTGAITSLQSDSEKNTWFVTTLDGKMYKLLPNLKLDANFKSPAPSTDLIITTNGLILASLRDGGVVAFDARTTEPKKIEFLQTLKTRFGIVDRLHEDKMGGIWMSGPGGNVIRADLAKESINEYSHLFNRKYFGSLIKYFFEDSNGLMWVGTDGGIVKVPTAFPPFKRYLNSTDPAHSENFISVRGMVEGANKSLYIGTYQGLFRIQPGGITTRHILENGNVPAPFQIVNYDSNRLLMTTVTHGMLWFNTNSNALTPVLPSAEPPNNQFYALYRDHEGTVWVGTRNSGVRILDENKKQLVRFFDTDSSKAISEAFVLAITEFPKGTIWLGTNNGLMKVDKKTKSVKVFDLETNPWLTNDEILCITPDEDGNIWFGSRGGGLMKLDAANDAIEYFNTTEGLSSNIVYGIISDNKYLWLSTEYGISRFNPETHQFRNYYAKDGLNDNEFNTAAHMRTSDGQIYFGGVNGVNSFFPADLTEKPFDGKIVLTSLKRGESELLNQSREADSYRLELPYDDRNLSLQFALTDYYQPQGNNFYYRIEGLDGDWVDLGPQNFLRISLLPAGEYQLVLKARNINDQESMNAIVVNLKVQNIFYRRTWFVLLSIAFISLLLYYGYKGFRGRFSH